MIGALRRITALLCLGAVTAACGPTASGGRRGPDRNLIDADEIAATQHTTAYAIVQGLRPHWLEVRAPSARMVKRIYVGDMYLGGVDALRQISASTIGSIQYHDGPAAMQRWGNDHAAGVIQVWVRSQ
jgi:hypothetical protein